MKLFQLFLMAFGAWSLIAAILGLAFHGLVRELRDRKPTITNQVQEPIL